MDPVTLTAGLAALLAPFLKKAAEKFADEAGSEAGKFVLEKAQTLWEKLRVDRQGIGEVGRGDRSGEQALEQFKTDPDAQLDTFQEKVSLRLARDPALAEELAALLAEVKRGAPRLQVVQEIESAERMVGVKARHLGAKASIEVTQKAKQVGEAIGVEIDEMD